MNRLVATVLVALLLGTAAVLGFRWQQQFKRVQQIELGATPFEMGTLNRMTLTNPSSSSVQLELRCFVGPRDWGTPSPMEKLVLLPRETREFQVYAEFANGPMPRILPNKNCVAVWTGPFGWERRAWRAIWMYTKLPYKNDP